MVIDLGDAKVSSGQRFVERGITGVAFGRRGQRDDRKILEGDRRS
jgi:hypothetical protein